MMHAFNSINKIYNYLNYKKINSKIKELRQINRVQDKRHQVLKLPHRLKLKKIRVTLNKTTRCKYLEI